MNSWAGPSTSTGGGAVSAPSSSNTNKKQAPRYRAMVVDSGPIIKESNVPQWLGRADSFYTVPAVIQEIRDAKARHQLQQQWIPLLGLQVKEPSAESMQRVVEFSKLTGDYPSLSAVDLQVLALVVDLELEGCLSIEHLRTTPKRTIGLGPITSLNSSKTANKEDGTEASSSETTMLAEGYDVVEEDDESDSDSDSESDAVDDGDGEDADVPPASSSSDEVQQQQQQQQSLVETPPAGSSWAKLVNPKEGSEVIQLDGSSSVTAGIASMKVPSTEDSTGGQWDDADEGNDAETKQVAAELESEFPSLGAAATVPYAGEDGDGLEDQGVQDSASTPAAANTTTVSTSKKVVFEQDTALKERLEEELRQEEEERERQKKEALTPISKSGKLYNSFRKYGKLMKPAPPKRVPKKNASNPAAVAPEPVKEDVSEAAALIQQGQSRILGAGGSAMVSTLEDMKAEDDDGEGWITSPKDIRVLKNHTGGGPLDPIKGSAMLTGDGVRSTAAVPTGPPNSQRAACTTTDFAMQNVLLQMGLVLLSVDGMQIRRLKSWVLRCGACFKIHTDPVDPKTGLRRMFCSHCGSDMMQRISASVDGKNGRLKLHFSKKKQNKHTSARGTKFSLPKAGSGNRFQGDLLLREDQLLTGAWNQKVKKNSGGQSRAHAQSIFGKDIASNVGCQATAMPNDIQVGFGRRNPNSAKGRERRGKKKKSSDRACGLRRY
jgi:RNA-binding protein NOB1